MSEPTIKAQAEGTSGGGKGAHARAGEAIAGNLYRGGGGQFQAGPAAQLQKRLEAIRAKRLAKGKGKKKGAGKKPAKPKATPADKLAARKQKVAANRTAAIAEMANSDAGLAPAGAANLLKLADGGAVEGAGADALVKMGLAEQSKTDDKYRLTAAGRSAAGALGRGDADGAIRAIGRAGEAQNKRQAKQNERTGKQAAAAKKKKERAARVAKRAKARAKPKAATKPPAAPAAPVKPDAPATPAAPVKPDTAAPKKPPATGLPTGPRRQTTKAAYAIRPDKGNDMLDYDTILDNLTAHAEALAELLDDDGAIKAGARHSGSDNKLIQAIWDAGEDICELAEALGATIADEETEPEDAGDMGESVGHEGAPVEGKAAEEISEETEDALKSTDADSRIGIEFMSDELAVCPGNTVKALADGDDGWTTGLLVQFGGNGDLSKWRDVFTSQTDYGHAKTSDVWTHHRMLPGPGKRRLTNPAELSRDDVGITIKHLLNMRDPYERALYDLVKQGKLGWSSGAPSHLVERKDIGEGRHEITSWILGADSSYTPCPAGGFGVDARAVKSLFDDAGIDLLAAIYEEPQAETKAADDTHARALLLELELLELEAIASTAV